MRTIFFIISLFVFKINNSQSITFQKYFGKGDEWGRYVEQTNDGGYIITSNGADFSGSEDIYLIKTDINGDTLWTNVLVSPVTDEWAYSVHQTFEGGFILAGSYMNGGYTDVYLIKTNSNGNIQWTKVYINPNKNDVGTSAVQTTDSGFVVLGTKEISVSNNDFYLLKTNSNGDTIWTKTYGGALGDGARAVQQTSDGGYIMTGFTLSYGAGGADVYLIKTNSNGDTLWTKTYGGSLDDEASSVQQTFDGGYIVTGLTKSFSQINTSVYLIKTDTNGDSIWTKVITNGYNAYASSVWQTTDGGYIMTGGMQEIGQNTDVYLVKTNSDGDTLWTKNFGGSNYDDGFCVQQTIDGGNVLVGITDSYGPINANVYLIKTDSLGNTSPLTTGVAEQQGVTVAGAVAVYPNPFSTQAHLVLPDAINLNEQPELIVYDLYGNETMRTLITSYRAVIEKGNLSAGMYFCKVVERNTVMATGKFIVQ